MMGQTIARLLSWAMLASFLCLTAAFAEETADAAITAKQLVVMVDGRFPTSGALTSGAGIVVGRKGGLVYIATAGHVVRDLMEEAEDIRVQFPDRPGLEVSATIFPANFDKGVDVALLIVPQSDVPDTIAALDAFPTARMSTEIQTGEGVYLFGQPGGKVWSGNRSPEKVQAARTTEIEVESSTVVPGLSGGAALDEGLRIVGIIVETDNGVARSIPIRLLKEILENGGYPFMLGDADAPMRDVEIDPLEELTKRGYRLSGTGILTGPEMAVREFVRALEMGRGEDANLFVAASVPLAIHALAIRVAVPSEFVDALLHSNLLKGPNNKTIEEWCSDDLVSVDDGKISTSSSVERYAQYDNSYLFRTACKEQASRIKELLTTQIRHHEEWLANVEKDKSRFDEIQKICRDVLLEHAPLQALAQNLYKAAHDQPYEPLDLDQLGEQARAIIHERIGGGEHIVFNSHEYDDYGFAKPRISIDGDDGQLISVYEEINRAAWSTANGARIEGDTLYYGSKPYMTIRAVYDDAAHKLIEFGCRRDIRFQTPNIYARNSYENAQRLLRLLGG